MMDIGDIQHPSGLRHQGGSHQSPSTSPSSPHKTLHKSLSQHDHDNDKSKKMNNSQLSSRKGSNSNKDQHTNNHHVAAETQAGGHYNHHNHPHSSMSGINGLMMLIDGLGLALITAATILESYELWHETYNQHWETNVGPISLWIAGKSAQIIGLIFLIGKLHFFHFSWSLISPET